MIGLNANFKTVKMPSAVNDLASLLQLLNDKKAFEKHLTKLVELTNEANEAISNVGKAKEINNLLVEADQLNEAAKKALEVAATKTEKALESTENKAALIIVNAQANAEKLLSDAEVKLEEAKIDWNEASISRSLNDSLEKELKEKTASLEERVAAIDKVEKEIAKKKELLSQL